MRSRRLVTILMLAALFLPGLAVRPPTAAAAGECDPTSGAVYFPETRHCVPKVFYDYWVSHGGLAQQGLPVSDDFPETSATDGKTYQVQYFERARFEYHPESKDPQYQVLLGLVGSEQYKAKYPTGAPGASGGARTTCPDGEHLFPQTGYCVPALFFTYWGLNGGLAQQGLPISPAFMEKNPSDQKEYLTQYFERARFEYHPESKDVRYLVLLGLLGGEQYDGKYPGVTPVLHESLTDPTYNPLPTVNDEDAHMRYDQGGYRMTLKNQYTARSYVYRPIATNAADAVNRLGLNDQRIEVEFTRLAGPADSGVSIYCRTQEANPDNYYQFTIGPDDGYYSILVNFGTGPNDYKRLAGGDNAPRLPAAQVGDNPTRLRADCIGDTLTLYVNGQKIAEVRDSTVKTGEQAGFGAENGETGTTDVLFRFFTYTLPRR